jgi:hypothetical protein
MAGRNSHPPDIAESHAKPVIGKGDTLHEWY